MTLTTNNISLHFPELNAVQVKKLNRLIIEQQLAELQAVRETGYANSKLDMWLLNRERELMEKVAMR